jgi:hypothetical protein
MATQRWRFCAARFWLVSAFAIVGKSSALACATCYGASDSPLAQGMNWGIATLLGVIGAVLAGVVAFFVHVGVRSTKANAGEPIQTADRGGSNAQSSIGSTRQTAYTGAAQAQPKTDFTRQTDKNS